jgi:rSAM/selenodomain-associated transferase 1
MADKAIILLFVKAPVRGQVKSRLAAEVGEESALDLYRCFVLDIVGTLDNSGYPFRICFYPHDDDNALAALLGRRRHVMPQEGKDLGKRMENAFRNIFSEGYDRAVLIGSDIPDLTPAVLREALESLEKNDVVIGPAADGGYYLIGFHKRSLFPPIFHEREWSTDRVFGETLEILRDASLRIHLAPEWRDVDTREDLNALAARSRGTIFDKSRTMEYLREKGVIDR